SRAVADIGGLRLSGFIAWAVWLLLHIVYLIDFRNRVLVLFDWAWSYLTYRRGSRLITGHRLDAGAPLGGPDIDHRPAARELRPPRPPPVRAVTARPPSPDPC